MKPTKLIFFTLIITIINAFFINSQTEELIEIESYRTVISPGEIYQGKISLNNPITTLKKQNIKFYSSTGNLIPVSPFLTELDNNYFFLYFEIPYNSQEGDYILKIEDQSFLINGILQEVEEEESISLYLSQPSVEITPGFIKIQTQSTGQILLTAKSKDIQTNIQFTVPNYISHPYITEQYINPGVSRTFTLTYNTTEATEDNIFITSGNKNYIFPIFIEDYSESVQEEENISINNTTSININPIEFTSSEGKLEKLEKHIEKEDSIEGVLYMKNKINISLSNMSITMEGDIDEIITIFPKSFETIFSFSGFEANVNINKQKSPSKSFYSGNIIVSNNDYRSSLPVEIIIDLSSEEFEEPIQVSLEGDESKLLIEEESSETDVPIDEIIPWGLSEGYEEEAKAVGMPLVILISILLIIAIIIFLLSGKKTTKKKSFKEVMKESERK